MYNVCIAGCWLLGVSRDEALKLKEQTGQNEQCYLVRAP